MKKIVLFAFVALMATGCSTMTRWEPTVNAPVDKNPSSLTQDMSECRVLANNAAGYVSEGAAGALVSAAGGAAEGAVIGALVSGAGGAGMAAPAGAAIGAIGGLWYSEFEADATFKRAFSACLWQRGHPVIN